MKKIEDKIYEPPDLENGGVCCSPPSCHDNIFPSLFHDDQVIHDDYKSYFRLPIYDSSEAPSVMAEIPGTPQLGESFKNHFWPFTVQPKGDFPKNSKQVSMPSSQRSPQVSLPQVSPPFHHYFDDISFYSCGSFYAVNLQPFDHRGKPKPICLVFV